MGKEQRKRVREYRWERRRREDSGAPREMEYANEEEWPPNSRQVLYYFFASSSRFECFQKKKKKRKPEEPNRFRPNFFLSVCQSASDRKKSFLKASIIAISPTILVPLCVYDAKLDGTKIHVRFRRQFSIKSRLTCQFMRTKFVSLYRERIMRWIKIWKI